MRKIFAFILLVAACWVFSGCGGRIGGPRFWWDDRNQTRLPDTYQLPDDIGAPLESGEERKISASGDNITDQNLRDYHADVNPTNDRSLLDF